MKIYRISTKEYFDVGHKQIKSLISVWQMRKDGTIFEKVLTFPDPKMNHIAIFGPDISKVIAEGRCDIGKKECSCAYYNDGRSLREWIKSLLRDKFGPDLKVFEF